MPRTTARLQFRIAHLLWAVLVAAILVRFPAIPLTALLVTAILAIPLLMLGLFLGIILGPLVVYLRLVESSDYCKRISDSLIAAGGVLCVLFGIASFATLILLVTSP